MPREYAPPPPLLTAVVGGTTTPTLPQLNNDAAAAAAAVSDEPSPPSSSFSIIIVIIVIASAIIVSASVYLLLRLLSRRFHRTFSVANDVVSDNNDDDNNCRNLSGDSSNDLINSLPLFTFNSVTAKTISGGGGGGGGDCAVCLCKFEDHDQLRLLPLCCHAFHARCVDTWLSSNLTCPLCRSTVHPPDSDALNKILRSSSAPNDRSGSFRIEIGNVSRRRADSNSGEEVRRRSYSMGSFEYIIDDGYEVSVESTTHRRDTSVDKESTDGGGGGDILAAEVGGGGTRSWLRDYVDRVASSASLSSRALSFRSSGRFFTGSSRRSDTAVPVEDLEAHRIGEEISELFRWLSGV